VKRKRERERDGHPGTERLNTQSNAATKQLDEITENRKCVAEVSMSDHILIMN
jgi:hypothetical protein